MKSIDDYPNVLIVPENTECPEDIIEDYIDLIEETKPDKEFMREILQMLFDDANLYTVQQLLIDQTKVNLNQLQEIQECVYEEVEEDDE